MDERYEELKESALLYLIRFETLLPGLINELRAAETKKLDMLADAVEGVSWLLEAMTALSVADAADVERMSDALSAVEEALADRDFTLLADILEYELLEQASSWRGNLESERE